MFDEVMKKGEVSDDYDGFGTVFQLVDLTHCWASAFYLMMVQSSMMSETCSMWAMYGPQTIFRRSGSMGLAFC